MKTRFPLWAALLICLVLVLGALSWNSVKSYTALREETLAPLQEGGAVVEALSNRGSDGLNLCVVAARYLPGEDPDLTGLETLSRELMESKASPSELMSLSDRQTAAFGVLLAKLESCSPGEKDREYMNKASDQFQQDDPARAIKSYNRGVEDFNKSLESLAGLPARIFGVGLCEKAE